MLLVPGLHMECLLGYLSYIHRPLTLESRATGRDFSIDNIFVFGRRMDFYRRWCVASDVLSNYMLNIVLLYHFFRLFVSCNIEICEP